MKYKLIALDLDGTLLTSEKNISEATFDSLKKASELGALIVPCTGRFYKQFPDCVMDLPFVNYAICVNGSQIYDLKNDIVLFEDSISNDESIKIARFLDSTGIPYYMCIDGWGYASEENYHKLVDTDEYLDNKYYRDSIVRYSDIIENNISFLEKENIRVQKFQYYTMDKELIRKVSEYVTEHFTDCSNASSGILDGEITSITSTKGEGIKHLAELLNIELEAVIAFGDGANDVSMLRAAGLGVAMGNAKPILFSSADEVTLSNDNDGIAHTIQKYLYT